MTIKRMDHVSVVVDDLPAAIAFFTTLGMTLEGEGSVEGEWVDRDPGQGVDCRQRVERPACLLWHCRPRQHRAKQENLHGRDS